jgi:hypothetical protein
MRSVRDSELTRSDARSVADRAVGSMRNAEQCGLDIDHDIELNMTHDTDVLEPEPVRPGGLVRKDLVSLSFYFQENSPLILWTGTTHVSPTSKTSGTPYTASIHSRS